MYAAHAQKKRKEASQLELSKCLTLLENATSDNDRFSAILEITKQIRSDTFTEDDKKVVLQAMGLQFLSRLITTTSLPKGCPNNLYKSIALSLLSTVCSEESVTVQPEMKSFLVLINDVLQNRVKDASSNSDMQQMTNDSLNIISHLAQHHRGTQQLVASGIFNTLLDFMTSQHCCNSLKVFSLIGAIVKHNSHLFMENSEKLFTVMDTAAQEMSRGSDMKDKMEYGRAATVILNHTPEVEYDIDSDWVRSMMGVVLKLLPVKLVPEHSEVVFYLLSAIVTHLSIHVLVLDGQDILNTIKALIARIAVEIYMLLDGIGPHNATSRYPQVDQVFKLLSEMVHFICGDFGETADADTIISLYRKLVDISNTIMEFLTSISNQEVALPRNHGVVLVSVRVLAAMLTEVTEDPTPALLKLIPFFNLLCQNIEYADDVKLEVKNVTQAALENIKMMGMQPLREESIEETESNVTSRADLDSIQDEQDIETRSAQISSSQSVDDHNPPVENLNDLHLSSSSFHSDHSSDSKRRVRFEESRPDQSWQGNNVHHKGIKHKGKEKIHTTLFYVPEGTKSKRQDSSLRSDDISEFSDTYESDDENETVYSYSDVILSQDMIDDFFHLQNILREEERAKEMSVSQRIRPMSSHQRKRKSESVSKEGETSASPEVWALAPDDILGFLLPAYMFLLEHNETARIMVKCDLFQTLVNFIQRSTSETLEGRCCAIPESTTINALNVICHLYECHSEVASTQLCLLDLLELSILSLPNLVSTPNPPPLTCLKMIEVCLVTLISNSGIRKRRSALHRIKHSRFRFFKAVVDYLSSFYEFKQNRRRLLTLHVKESFKGVWATASDFWCVCVAGLCNLVKTEDDLQETLIKTAFLPCFMSFLAQSHDSDVKNFHESTQKILEQMLSLIENATEASNALRGFIIQSKGMMIARKYNLEKMELRLSQHLGRDSH